ncbi:hypothetical protein SADUNF_Sadunf16G0245500 [Salix dunnii]|uniref:Glutamate receptor n=1 Tax=Salix dunnii TaxID=1413687 RepID=A0A835JDX8_9ROSI|nr:hypothetical protein SADUNF_Sadunf16G0245500 [Salix dunnii]
MKWLLFILVLSLLYVVLLLTPSGSIAAGRSSGTKGKQHVNGVIGAIVDRSSRIGKEEIVAMEIAREDVYRHFNQNLTLHVKDADQRNPIRAALAGLDLINIQQVEAIVGPQTWEEVSLVAHICTDKQIPIFSLADTTPEWTAEKWPFVLGASHDNFAQMKAIAGIVQSWNWHQVTVIHEEVGSWTHGVMPYLHDSLREVDAEISQFVGLSPFASSDSLSRELENLQKEQCRVFVVHLSLPLAVRLFEMAKKLKMMEKDYVWITTHHVTSLVHSINASIISSMQGIVGVKSYLSETGQRFQDFSSRFRKRFRRENSEEENNEPGIHAVQAYDAIWTIARAFKGSKGRNQELLERVLQTDFQGLSGKVQFNNHKVAPTQIFQIINVVGKSYRELGFWSSELGFSETIGKYATHSSLMIDLEQVLWPGGPRYTPRGWTELTRSKPLLVGVPAKSGYKEYVSMEYSQSRNSTSFDGLAIQLFEETVRSLPFYLPYEFVAFNGTSYDDLVGQIGENFDAVVGDVAIVASRYKRVEFSHPFTETGLMLIVPARSSNKAWSFIKPFTKPMWASITVITIYNGFVVWLIERHAHPELRGSMLHQIGVMLWLSFNTLFSLQGGKLHSNLSRMSVVVWLFVALVVIQTYTANLTSMLTVQRLEPAVTSVEELLKSNAAVGYCSGSNLEKYLVEVLHFPPANVEQYGSAEEYAQAFDKKEIAAAFIGTPLAKILLAKYCKKFMQAGPTFSIGGFGFAFPWGSPLLESINEALLKVSENGTLVQLENKFIREDKQCQDKDDEIHSLSSNGFRALFIITGGTSTIALVIYIFRIANFSALTAIRGLMLTVFKHWCYQSKRFKRRVSDVDSLGNSSPHHASSQLSQV